MKKIIDSKGRIFGKVNIVDFVIVVAVVVLALSAIMKFDKMDATMTSDKVIEYTFKIAQVRQPTVDALNAELAGLEELDTEKELGDIVNIEITPAKELVKLADGSYKNVEHKEFYDVLLTVQVKGTETEDNYYTLTGKKLIVGDNVTITNGHASTNGTIKSVRVVE